MSSANSIAVTTHKRPDGDAVGSAAALARIMQRQNKKVVLYIQDPIPPDLKFVPGADLATNYPPDLKNTELIIALDHSELGRTGLGLKEEITKAHTPLAAIDHHVTSDREGEIIIVVPEAAATCEILTEIAIILELPLDHLSATALLTGIFTDTGSFQHANVSPHVMQTTSFLLKKGANLPQIVKNTYGRRSLPALRIMGIALTRLQTNPQTGAAISIITQKDLKRCNATADDLSGVVNMLNTTPEASFSLLLTEYEQGKLKGSLRSEPDKNVDVSKIATRFGGGGHALASGFEVAGKLVRDNSGNWHIE